MSASEAILERWIARTAESYAAPAVPFVTGDEDPFRNPVGHTLRRGLGNLLQQLLGDMDADVIGPALDSIVRLRAVQDFTASEAVRFVFLLKPIVRELPAGPHAAVLDSRIDELALMAFDTYMRCREQIAEIRANERGRIGRVKRGVG